MSRIATVEDAIIAQLKTTLGNKVRAVSSAPNAFSGQEAADRLRLAPACYVGFMGGDSEGTQVTPAMDGSFVVYVVTENAAGEEARRRGDVTAIGAYDLVEITASVIHELTVPDIGTLMFSGCFNLFAEELDQIGLSVYSVAFKVPMFLPLPDLSATLNNFATFEAQYDIAPFLTHTEPLPDAATSVDAGSDQLSLPQ
jgi:phage gp37-like protein